MRTSLALSTACCGVAAILFMAACSDDEAAPTPAGDGGPGAGGASGAGGGKATGGKGSGGKASGGTSGAGGTAGSGGTSGAGGTAGTGGGKGGVGGTAGTDAGGKAGAGGTPTDSGDAATVDPVCGTRTQIECGKYLVEHIDACGDCHSPRNPDGSIDMTKFLAGNPAFADLDPNDPNKGLIGTPNLTQLKNQTWTAQDIENAILNGTRPAARGGGLFPIMPYQNFHNMKPEHAAAIAAYILDVGTKNPITNVIPSRQPLPAQFSGVTLPIAPVDASKIPNTTLATTNANYAKAQLGKYLAAEAGICIECHTTRSFPTLALDSTKFFSGGEQFQIGGPFGTVTSLNITPATNGIAGWAASDVVKVLAQGIDKSGMPLCPPMPFGPFGAFGGMAPAHQEAIGTYLTTIPGNANPTDGGRWPMCVPPSPPDGGMSDSGTPMDASTG